LVGSTADRVMLGRRRPNVQKLARRGKAARIVRALRYHDEIVDRAGRVFDLGVDVRRQAAGALAELDAPEALDALVDALEDEAPSVRAAAAEALGARRDDCAVADLAWVAASPAESDGGLRAAARRALGRLEAPGTAKLFTGALIDRGGGMDDARETVEAALSREGEVAVRAVVEHALDYLACPGNEPCARAERVVDWVGRRAVPTLIAALGDAQTRGQAAAALGRIHDSRATEPLMEMLSDSEPDVRTAAARALGDIKDPSAVEALVAVARDPEYEVREAAMTALEGLWSVAVMSGPRERLADHQHTSGDDPVDPPPERSIVDLHSLEDGRAAPARFPQATESARRHGKRRLFGRPPEPS
jgi:HEAT repeat protein